MRLFPSHQALSGALQHASRSLGTFASSGTPSSTQAQCRSAVSAVQTQLEMALESVQYIRASAEQAYLEHDPSERMPRVAYSHRYMNLAREQLEAGLKRYQGAAEQYGQAEVNSASPPGLGLLVADSMLARDRLDKQLGEEHKISCTSYSGDGCNNW